jgi:hypothetical protein
LSKLNWLLWLAANGFAAILLTISPVFYGTNAKRVDELLGTTGLAAIMLPATGLVLAIGSLLLPGLSFRRISKQFTLFKWTLVCLAYMFLFAFFLAAGSVIVAIFRAVGLPLFLPSILIFHFLITPFCWLGLALVAWKISKNRHRTLVLWLSFASAELIARIQIAYKGTSGRFAEYGFDSLDLQDVEILVVAFFAAAAGAVASGKGIAHFVRSEDPRNQE